MSETRKAPLLLLGLLSMTFAEVFSGSSPGWFLDIGGWILPFPLYWSHTVFFLGLAHRYQKASIPHLYLWGVLFGLYETWVTKVVWAGFFDSPPLIAPVLGFAVFETLVIVLFWHPVFSFMVPVLVFEMLTYSPDHPTVLLPGHLRWLVPRWRSKIIALVFLFIGGANLAVGCGGDIGLAAVTSLGSILLIYFAYLLARRGEPHFTVESVFVGRRGLIISGVYIVCLYAVTFFVLRPEALPSIVTIIITLQIYAIVAAVLYAAPTSLVDLETVERMPLLGPDWVWRRFLIFVILATVLAAIAAVVYSVVAIALLLMAALGPALFAMSVIRLWRTPDYRVAR